MPVDFQNVKRRRNGLGLSLTDAARAAGWTPQKWANFEAARRPDPRFSTVETVARVLGCKVDDLIRRGGVRDSGSGVQRGRKRKQT